MLLAIIIEFFTKKEIESKKSINKLYGRYMKELGFSKTDNPTEEEIKNYDNYLKLITKTVYKKIWIIIQKLKEYIWNL